jgi:hypothetical protein
MCRIVAGRTGLFLTAMIVVLVGRATEDRGATFNCDTAVNSRRWLNSANWTGGPANKAPGVDMNPNSTIDNTSTDIAVIGNVPFDAAGITQPFL